MGKYIKFDLPTGRSIYVNTAQITVICQDPITSTKVEVFLADGIRYNFTGTVADILNKLDIKTVEGSAK